MMNYRVELVMFKYHDKPLNLERLGKGICRCGSNRQAYDLSQFVQSGRIYDPRQPSVILTTPKVRRYPSDEQPEGGGYGRTYIFAVNLEFKVHVAPDEDRNQANSLKHETLFHNEHVLAAGEMWIHEGIISGLNDHSATYLTKGKIETDVNFCKSFIEAVNRNTLPLDSDLEESLKSLIESLE